MDFAVRSDNGASCPTELSTVRMNRYFGVSWSSRPNAQDDAGKLIQGQGAPCVAIAALPKQVFGASCQMIFQHFTPGSPESLRLVVEITLLQRTEKIRHHGNTALCVLIGMMQCLQQVGPSFFRGAGFSQCGKNLAVLAQLLRVRTVPVGAVRITAIAVDGLAKGVGSALIAFCGLFLA